MTALPRGRHLSVLVLLGCLLAAGCAGSGGAPSGSDRAGPSGGGVSGPPGSSQTGSSQPGSTALATGPAPLPIEERVTAGSLQIPSIGVSVLSLEPLGLLADGRLAAPVEWQSAGVYADGPVPGERGPAVVAGHVDSVEGPAVFHRLQELRPGDLIEIGRSDGRTVTFRVDRSVSVPKDDFPTDLIYGPTPDAQLRLITCSGRFDTVTRSYVDNTVVLATAVG